ncbi:18.2 kDa class I heat shock protein [Acorus calamus]|uniref:18.2 kDa class I heat shock protein n=1 Tax=Acorus calamus TaxID=4465 RepID=A0AAV9F0P6_ACOCL|nr:18.2 kDa class I heat shock protein [Acorus calamus]
MSLMPYFFGRRNNVFDPFSHDVFERDRRLGQHSHRLEGDAGGARVQGGSAWAEEGGGEGGGRGGKGPSDLRREEQGGGGEERHVAQPHRLERSSGRFLRRFRLPEGARVDQVKAAMEDGVLTVTVPKEQVKKPEVKSIDISG